MISSVGSYSYGAKEEYDIWAMKMEHYLEYIDNEVWKVIQNGNSKKRISTGKDGIVRVLSPVTAAEIQAKRFHGMDDAKEIWKPSELEGLEKGYDRFQQLLSQLEAHGAEVSTEDANHKFLRSLPPACIFPLAKQQRKYGLLHEDLEQINDVDIEEMDINWQIAMIAIRMKNFYKKTGRRVRVDGKTPVG
ncbi:hypothetical protein Tco_0856991 [Tanacetum coccineum]|uniref:Uncharacterized protein n=1 Tax=Tanacetum coccineum TaxID=301880 RepID=A0ABQ5B6R9_9ASTR